MCAKISDSIDDEIIKKVLELLPDQFHTKDVSGHPLIRKGHPDLVSHTHYHAFIGKFLKNNLRDDKGFLLLKELKSGGSRGSYWHKSASVKNLPSTFQADPINGIPNRNSTANAVRKEHYNTLDFMKTERFCRIKEIFESYNEIGGVYFRPVANKVTVVDLHINSPKPRIGVGEDPYVYLSAIPQEIERSMHERIRYLISKRKEIKAINAENKLESNVIREAQNNHLVMPGFPDYLKFIHSQWRIDKPDSSTHSFTDIIAVDIRFSKLVIIELKAKAEKSAYQQVKEYVTYFFNNKRHLLPFFLELSGVMGKLYSCDELMNLDWLELSELGLVAWPDHSGKLQIQNLEEYEKSISKTQIDSESIELGPQCNQDSTFRAEMRLHQSWYRASKLKVPCGFGPNQNSITKYGNMLTVEDGNKGLNFLTQEIFNVVNRRISERSGAVDPFRLLNNMLSSQPLCFNLFGLFDGDLKLATDFWNYHFPNNVREITAMKIEYAPSPNTLYLNDRTAFDAYFEYNNRVGKKGFIGVEVKYTEPFSQQQYDTPVYRKWSNNAGSPWKTESYAQLPDIRWNQLWRDHLLAISMLAQGNSPFAEGMLVLVRHPADKDCERAVNSYKSLLKEHDTTFFDLPMDILLAAWEKINTEDRVAAWLERFKERYKLNP